MLMKDYLNQRKSKLLLFAILAMIVGGVSPAWAQKALPYEYGFEDYNLDADGWTKVFGTSLARNNSECAIYNDAKKTGSYGFRFSSYQTQGENAQYLISPELDANKGVVVKFAYAASSTSGTELFKVGYSTTNTDPASFTWIDDISYNSKTWADYEGICPAGTKYVAVYYYSNYQYRLYVDDFSFTAPPTCIKPNGLTVDDITSSSVKVSWTSEANAWNVQYKKAADDDWTPVESISDNPYTIKDLTPATAYEVRVQANCGDGDVSDFTTALSFTTDCGEITEFPYTENFNSLTTGIPSCWDNSEGNATTYKWGYYASGHDGNCVRFNSYHNSDGVWNALKTPTMNLSSGKAMQLSFWYKNPTGGDFSVYVSNDGGKTYTTELATGLTGQSDWKQMEIPIPTTFAENVVIVFKGTSNYGNGDAYIYLDDVTIEDAPSCIKPIGLNASEVDRYSVSLSWTSEASAWNVQYKTAADAEWTLVETTENPFTLDKLTANTAYTVRVQTNCGGGDVSAWSDEISLTTLEECPLPADLTVSDITAHEATLAWTLTNNTFDVLISTVSETPSDDAEPTAKDIKENTYTFEKLTSETKYYVWVRSVNGEAKSAWVGVDFTTLISCHKPTNVAVTEITSSAAKLTWTAGAEEQDAWQVECSLASDFAKAEVYNVTKETSFVLESLDASTTYYVRVRSNCGDGDYSAWAETISFTTLQVAVAAEDYTNNFEKECDWLLVNGDNTNAWAWGSATNNGGEKALYISNDGGTTNAYSIGSSAMVYAKKLFSFEGGAYTFAFDWMGNGESTYDYLRVALVPATVELTAGTSKPSGFNTSTLPTGWIALDGGSKLNLSSEWKHQSVEMAVEAGSYNVVLAWYNDNMSGSNPAAAIDNFRVAVLTCPTPTELAVSDVTAHGATLAWAATENTWEVYCTTEEGTPAADVQVTGTASTNSYTFTGLKGETKYYVWVRSTDGKNKSEWAGANFTTGIACFVPTDLAVTSVTAKSAVVTWQKGSEDQKQWELSYSTTKGQPNEGTIVSVTETTYELNDLLSGTTYYVYVRGVNSEDDKSQWSEMLEVVPGMFTVNNGTQTNEYVPLYGYYVDNTTGIRSQFIIPAADLAAIANSELTKMVFYSSLSSQSFGGSFKVYVKEVENTSFDDNTLVDWNTLQQVYSGTLTIANGKMTIEFAEPVEYLGGNLMIGICQTAKGNYKSSPWYGVTTEENTALGGYASSISQYKFLPKTSFYFTPMSDEAVMAVSTEALDFGKVHPSFTDEQKQLTFSIQNKGKAELKNISVSYVGDQAISVPVVENASIKAKGDAAYADLDVTVTVSTEVAGDYAGTITIKADGQADATIAVSATVLDANKNFETFAGNALPDDWTTKGVGSFTTGSYASSYVWTFTDGYASYKSAPGSASSLDNYTHSLITPSMQFDADGEKLMFRMKKDKTQYGGDISYLLVQYTTDGSTWTDTKEGAWENANISTDWTDAEVTIPGDAKKVRFVACGIGIDDVYGGQIVPEAKFEFAAADYSFGVIMEATTTTAYTVKNPGSGELTGLSVTSDNENFTVAVENDATTIAARGETTFTVTMKADVKGSAEGKITVKADGFDAVEFNVSGYVLDTDAIIVDFTNNELPDGWTKSNFYISGGEAYYNGYVATLTSPSITVAEGQKMVIYARGASTRNASLDVKTSTDNGATWSDAVNTFTTELRQNTTDYVLLTVDNIEPGNYKLKFTGDYVGIKVINGYTYNQDAPALGVTLAGAAVANGYNDNFGLKVKEQPAAHTYTIKNTGTGTLTGTITSSVPEHFTVSESEFSLGKDETLDFDLNLVFNETYEDKASVITIHPTVEGLTDIVINASATTRDPNVWEEDFEDGMPAFWTTNGWSVSTPWNGGNGTKVIGPGSNTTATLTTPRLQAAEGAVLRFDVLGAESEYYSIKMQYSTDEQQNWSDIVTYTESGTMEFVAPAAGYYYLRFTGNYTYLDNFEGFTLALPDHIMAITSSSIPSYGLKEGVSFNATVTVKDVRGVDEEFEANVYQGDVVIGTATGSVEANSTKQLTIAAIPTKAGDAVEMHIEVTYAGGTLTTDVVTRSVAAAVRLDLSEESTEEFEAGTYDVITLDRTYTAPGWNTIVLPFGVSDVESVFGEGAKAYAFTGYSDEGELSFSVSSEMNRSTPYVLYVPAAIDEPLQFSNITISSYDLGADNIKLTKNGATFQGSYQPIAAPNMEGKYGVTKNGKIAKGSSNASMKGFRAYFELPEGANGARLVFYNENGEASHIGTIMADQRENDAYDLKGMRVETLKKGGFYIVGGKKVVVK